MKIKTIGRYLSVIIVSSLLSACSSISQGETSIPADQVIEIDTKAADAVTMYYGEECFSLYEEDPAVITQIADRFQGIELKKSEKEMDGKSAFTIYFTNEDKQVESINIDADGVIWLASDNQIYEALGDPVDYEALADVYQEYDGRVGGTASCPVIQ